MTEWSCEVSLGNVDLKDTDLKEHRPFINDGEDLRAMFLVNQVINIRIDSKLRIVWLKRRIQCGVLAFHLFGRQEGLDQSKETYQHCRSARGKTSGNDMTITA